MKEKRFEKNNCGRWRLLLVRVLLLCILLPCMHIQTFAATQIIKNGYYMIQSGNSSSKVLDINNWNLNNGGNLEIYQKNKTTNQIYYIQYVKTEWNWNWVQNTQYYTIRCLHSGRYIHTADGRYTNSNVHQWDGCNTDNALWGIRSAENGFYYFMNKASGACLDNSGGNTTNGNNVITYPWNKSYAQKWMPVSVSKPTFAGHISNYVSLGGTYNKSDSKTVSGDVTTPYPVTNLQIGIFNTSGKYIRGQISHPNYLNFSYKYKFNFSGLSPGRYYFKVRMWDVWGDITSTSASYFNITAAIPVNRKIKVFSQQDDRWKNVRYGYSNKAGTTKAYLGKGASGNAGSGCGVLALTNAVYYLNGSFISPETIAKYSVKYGYRVNGVGTAYGLYKSFADNRGSHYGFAYAGYTSKWDTLKSYLAKGHVAICGKSGHIMALVNYNKNTGRYLLLDSYPTKSRGTSGTGYIWATKSYLQNTVGIRSSFYVLKSTK